MRNKINMQNHFHFHASAIKTNPKIYILKKYFMHNTFFFNTIRDRFRKKKKKGKICAPKTAKHFSMKLAKTKKKKKVKIFFYVLD